MTDDAVNPTNTDNTLANSTGMDTPPELESSLGPLTHTLKADNIRLLKELSGGKTSSRVFQAEIHFPDSSRTVILKFHRADALKREIDNYSKLSNAIEGSGLFTKILNPTETRENLPPGENTGVIAYTDAGNQLAGPCTSLTGLINDYLTGGAEWQRLKTILEAAFTALEQLYKTGKLQSVNVEKIHEYYQDRWVPHYRAETECFDPGNQDRWPLLTQDKFNPANFSKTLKKEAIGPSPSVLMNNSEKPVTGKREIIIDYLTFNGRWGKTLYLGAKPSLLSIALDTGALREEDIKAIEKTGGAKLGLWVEAGTTRYDFYNRRLETVFPGIDFNAGGFKIGTAYYHNPLKHISVPFNKLYLTGHVQTARAHGDLHPGNILVVRDNPVFIDYGLAEGELPFGVDYARFLGSIIRDPVAAAVPYETLQALLRHTFEETALNYPPDETAQRALRLLQYVFGKTRRAFANNNIEMKFLWLHLYGFAWIGLKWQEAGDNKRAGDADRACFLLACHAYVKLFQPPLADESFPLLTPSAVKGPVEYLQGLPGQNPAHRVLDRWVSALEKKNAGAADRAGLHGKEYRAAMVSWLDKLVEKGMKIAAADAPLLLAAVHLNSLALWMENTGGALFEKTAPPAPPQKLLTKPGEQSYPTSSPGFPGASSRELLENNSELKTILSEAGLKSVDILALGNILAVFPGINESGGDERVQAVGGLVAMLNALTFGKERIPRYPQEWPKSRLNPEEFWRWVRAHAAEVPKIGDNLLIDNKYGALEVTFTPVVSTSNEKDGTQLSDELTAWARYLLSGTGLPRILERYWRLGFIIKPARVKVMKKFSQGHHDVGRIIHSHFEYQDRQRDARGTGRKEQYLAPGMHTVTPGEPGGGAAYRSLVRLSAELVSEESEDNGQTFLSGGVPKWSDIHGHFDAPRDRVKEFTAMFRKLEGAGETVILWIYSACGNGKTTAAMRLAYDLVKAAPHDAPGNNQKLLQGVKGGGFLEKSPPEVYWRPVQDAEERLDMDLLKELTRPAVVIVDDAQLAPNLVNDIKQYLEWREKNREHPPLHFVFVYQGMQWNQNKPHRDIKGRVKHLFWYLDPLSEGEAAGIARELVRSGLVDAGQDPSGIATRLIIRDRDSTDLLTAMLLVVKGRTDFAEIIHELLRGIRDPLLLEAYTTVAAVCRLHEKNYVTPRLLAYPYGMDVTEYKKRVLNPLNAELRSLTGERSPNQLRSRHRRIADIAFHYLVKSTDAVEKDIYVDLVKSAVEASRHVGWQGELKLCTRLLINLPCRELRRACYRELLEKESLNSFHLQTWALMESREGRLDLARVLYYKAATEDIGDAGPWQTWALMEAEEGNDDMARELFARGTTADRTNAQSWQAWALMEAELENYEEARRLFNEGTTVDRSHVQSWQAWALMEEKCGNLEKAREYMERSTPYQHTEKARGIYDDFKKRAARRSAGETVELPPLHSEGKRKFLPDLPQPWRKREPKPGGPEQKEKEARAQRELEYFSGLTPRELVNEILARLETAGLNPGPGLSCPPDTVCYLGKCPYRD